MRLAYLLTVTIHVHAAMFWLGGMFFLGLVGAPVLRTVEPARCGNGSSANSISRSDLPPPAPRLAVRQLSLPGGVQRGWHGSTHWSASSC